MVEISIIIPVFNSEENLTELHRQIKDAMQSDPYEIIFVNDCSTDKSWEAIKFLCESDKNIMAINFRKNFGQDNAILAGIKHSSGNYIVIMDDDLQHSPIDILKLYDKCKTGFDVCYAYFSEKNQAVWKNIGSSINSLFARFLLKKPKGVYMSPFKIIKSDIAKELLEYTGPFPYIEGLLLQITQNITSVEIDHHERFKGKGNFNFFKSFSVFLRTLTSFSVLPLRLATIMGFIISILGFLLAIYYLIEYFRINKTVEGWTSLMISTLIIGGLMLTFLGLIGEYLGRMFLTLNKKPQFSIREIINKVK